MHTCCSTKSGRESSLLPDLNETKKSEFFAWVLKAGLRQTPIWVGVKNSHFDSVFPTIRMVSLSLSNKRHTYIHERESKPLREAIDIHHVIINGSRASAYTRCRGLGFFLVLLASSMYFLLEKDNPVRFVSWIFLLSGFLVILQTRKLVKKESVIIMSSFGIQLQTQYSSGKTVSRFIPIGKILKPVLVENVTPITCYWSLSLFLRGEEQLTLVFKELHPPLKMLVPIWKALCDVMDTDQTELKAEEHVFG